MQSVPEAHLSYSLPGPPSSQAPSEAPASTYPSQEVYEHVLLQLKLDCGTGGVDGGGSDIARVPQSRQSVPKTQSLYSLPGPPSSQSPSEP